MERWEAFAVIFCVHPVPVFLRISGIPLSASRFCFSRKRCIGGEGGETACRVRQRQSWWPDWYSRFSGWWFLRRWLSRDISFGVHYRYENRVVHHHIEVEDAELVEQNAWYKDEGRCHIKQNVAGSVSQRVTNQNRQEDNQKMQQAYDKNYACGYDGGFCPLCKKLLTAFMCLRHVVVRNLLLLR